MTAGTTRTANVSVDKSFDMRLMTSGEDMSKKGLNTSPTESLYESSRGGVPALPSPKQKCL